MKTLEQIQFDLDNNEGLNCTQDELLSYLAYISITPKEKLEAKFNSMAMEMEDVECCKKCKYYWSYRDQLQDDIEPEDIGTCEFSDNETCWIEYCDEFRRK